MGWMKEHYPEIIFLTVVCFIFLVLATHSITLPGLYSDEALEPAIAMNIFYHDEKLFSYVDIQGMDIFAMLFPYIGPTEVYSFLPFYYLFGVNLFSVRMATIFFGLVEVIIFFYFAKEFFNKEIAYIATVLFATMPTVIFYSRQGAYPNHIILMPVMLFFLFLLKYLKQKKIIYVYLASFFFGLGFTTKITFWWLILPLGVSFFFLKKYLNLDIWQTFVSFDFFCLGAAPLLLYNIASKGGTFVRIFTQSPSINYHILSNLAVRFTNFTALLNSNLTEFRFGSRYSTYFLYFFIVAAIFILLYSFRHSETRKKNFFIVFLICSVLLQSIFTVSNLLELHLYLLVPFCLLLASEFLYIIYAKKKTLFFIIFVMILGSNIFVVYSYYRILNVTGGTTLMSDTIYELVDYLQENNISRPLAVDWGFAYNIRILTDNKVKPFEIFVYPHIEKEYQQIFEQLCRSVFINQDNVYIFTDSSTLTYDRFTQFNSIAESMLKKVVLEKTFYQRDGKPLYLLYRVIDK